MLVVLRRRLKPQVRAQDDRSCCRRVGWRHRLCHSRSSGGFPTQRMLENAVADLTFGMPRVRIFSRMAIAL
eukprot:1602671-Pyramimonas_sp.AAC.1